MSPAPATFGTEEPAHRWREPLRSIASRRPSEKPSRTSARPVIVTTENPREILCESELEAKAAFLLMARPDCTSIKEQPDPVPYLDYEGKLRQHTFDFLMIRRSGQRIAIAVKPLKLAIKRDLQGLLKHIARQMDPAFASGILLLTDANISPAVFQNSRLIHDARRLPDPEIDDRVRAVIATLKGTTTIDCIVATAGLNGHDQGFYAVVRAIGSGALVTTRSGLIDPGMAVRRAAGGTS